MKNKPITVLVVDDSALVRKMLTEVLSSDDGIEVVGQAQDPIFAQRKIAQLNPDVITLDIEMPRMDGLTFLKKIMKEDPRPVVICSSLTDKNATLSFNALRAGAVDIISKPKTAVKDFFSDAASQICDVIKAASRAKLKSAKLLLKESKIEHPHLSIKTNVETTDKIIAIGASTGGTEAIRSILMHLPENCPGIVVVQHMPEKFTNMFAHQLNQMCRITVEEATDGRKVLPGHALVAPGHLHMKLERSGKDFVVRLDDGPLVNRHRPSVDTLFYSVAENAGVNAMGILLTGMGEDGARGLKAMAQSGAKTVAQDEESSIVFGMPKAAIDLKAAQKVLPLTAMPNAIIHSWR